MTAPSLPDRRSRISARMTAGVLVGALALAVLAFVLLRPRTPAIGGARASAGATRPVENTQPQEFPAAAGADPVARLSTPKADEPAGEDAAAPLHPVDLDRLQADLPDNLYWLLGAPTTDPVTLAKRRDYETAMTELRGRLLSGEATPAEIEDYVAERRRLSEDYQRFAALVLERHGARLPENERGLYELTIQLHQARLDELPRVREDALARHALQEERRAAYRARAGAP